MQRWFPLGARIGNLLFFVAVLYLALRIAPVCRPVLFCLALMPMTIHQAASASADGPTIASAFLLFAYVLHLAKRLDIMQSIFSPAARPRHTSGTCEF